MEKEPCTRFCSVLVRFDEVIKLQSFEFSVSDIIPANVQNISPLVFYRSSYRRCSVKKGVFRNFAKFTGKHLCQRLFFSKFLKTSLWHRCFSVNFAKLLRIPFLQNTSEWLLLFLCMFCKFYWEKFSYNVIQCDVIHANEHIKHANCGLQENLKFFVFCRFFLMMKRVILTLSWRGRYHIETSPLICRANQWTGFYMITASVMKVLTKKCYFGLRSLLKKKCLFTASK